MRLTKICLSALLLSGPAIAAPAEMDKAFSAAFGHPAPYTMTASGGTLKKPTAFIYTPSGLENVAPGIVALVSKGKLADFGCHACSGTLAIHYLKRDGEKFVLLGAWPAIGGAAPYGEAAAWAVRKDLDDVPVLVSREDDGGQGCYETWADLIALTPERPVVRISLVLATKYEPEPESKKQGYDLTGELIPVERGKRFVVQYSGTRSLRVEYLRSGNVYIVQGKAAPVC
jgi:hypothetical protein